MNRIKRKAFVGVKSYYYKQKAAEAVLDHAHSLRNGFTKSVNVHSEHSLNNKGYYFHGANSCAEALSLMCQKHKEVTGKKVRCDNNILFEHVVFLSEFQYTRLEKKFGAEKIKLHTMKRLINYAEMVKKEFGFTILGVDLHLDEGRYENGKFIRNIHAHVQFMNYSFEKRIAPLRHMMKKGKNQNGRTNNSNLNFMKLQDFAFDSFSNMGFMRGESKDVTGREHLTKEDFVKNKLKVLEHRTSKLIDTEQSIKEHLVETKKRTKELDSKLAVKQTELQWLERQISSLQTLKENLSNAIRDKY